MANFLTDTGADTLFDSILGAYYIRLSIGKYDRPTPFKESKWTPEKAIILPLPTELHDDTSVDYQNQNMEVVGDVINQNFQGLAGRAALGIGAKLPGAIAGIISQTLMDKTDDIMPIETIGTAIQQSFGVAPNPNPTVAFKGPELRTFSYSWLLQPRNEAESDKIQKIIKILKSRSLPANSIKDQVSILDYPSLCQVNFYPWDKGGGDNNWGWSDNSIIKYKKCFISNVNVNYTPSNIPAFFRGKNMPVAVQLTLTFREIEFMLANDWEESLAGTFDLKDITKNWSAKTDDITKWAKAGASPSDQTQAQP